MSEFSGKVALVTGGGTGIGKAAALAYARRGAAVVIGNRDEAAGLATVELIRRSGARAEFRRTDVARPGDIESLVGLALERFGRLDFAFNNAGVEGRVGPFVESQEEDFDRVFGINVKGVWRAMRAQIPAMLRSAGGRGVIINNSSVAGHVGFPGAAIYVASKHAVEGLTKTAAVELAKTGVRVNTVNPGPIQTPMFDRFTGGNADPIAAMVPMGRVGTPEEVAGAVIFLSSDAASYITGQHLTIDGGFTAQ